MSGQLGNGFGANVIVGAASIYLVMGVKNATNEFTDEEDFFGGASTFPVATLRSNNYEGRIPDISILPRRENKRASS